MRRYFSHENRGWCVNYTQWKMEEWIIIIRVDVGARGRFNFDAGKEVRKR